MKNIFEKLNDAFGFSSVKESEPQPIQPAPSSGYGDMIASPWVGINSKIFDGEKTPGELGRPINLIPDYRALRQRAYEADLESDVIKIITGKFFKWTVGSGLKLQSEPNEVVLESEGITEDFKKFRSITEARFSVYANSTFCDYTGMNNLHKIANEAFRCAFLGGDCLVILRYENGKLNTQIIDGQEISTPLFDSKFISEATDRGHSIKHGIELDKKGTHIAYYIEVEDPGNSFITKHERILARGENSGKLMAWMIYGSKHRINHHRGISSIAPILEKTKKLDRYTEASVSSAEERAKVVYAVEHNQFSTGENPLVETMRKNMGGKIAADPFDQGETVSKRISLTTNKQTFNMPVGSKLSSLDSNSEDNYDAFFKAVFVQLCAAVDIPPEVALQQYNSNYSASRAAINGWGYIINIFRKDFADSFYKKFYAIWLETEILNNKIKSPAYLEALKNGNYMVLESFYSCKFTGVNMPHIDPLKEVKAVREMLGDPENNIQPLISNEQADEMLNLGDWSENMKKYKEEKNDFIEPKPIEVVDPAIPKIK